MRRRTARLPLLPWTATLAVLAGVVLAATPLGAPLAAQADVPSWLVAATTVTVATGTATTATYCCMGATGCQAPLEFGATILLTFNVAVPAAFLLGVTMLKALVWDCQRRLGGDPSAQPRTRPRPELSGLDAL